MFPSSLLTASTVKSAWQIVEKSPTLFWIKKYLYYSNYEVPVTYNSKSMFVLWRRHGGSVLSSYNFSIREEWYKNNATGSKVQESLPYVYKTWDPKKWCSPKYINYYQLLEMILEYYEWKAENSCITISHILPRRDVFFRSAATLRFDLSCERTKSNVASFRWHWLHLHAKGCCKQHTITAGITKSRTHTTVQAC